MICLSSWDSNWENSFLKKAVILIERKKSFYTSGSHHLKWQHLKEFLSFLFFNPQNYKEKQKQIKKCFQYSWIGHGILRDKLWVRATLGQDDVYWKDGELVWLAMAKANSSLVQTGQLLYILLYIACLRKEVPFIIYLRRLFFTYVSLFWILTV